MIKKFPLFFCAGFGIGFFPLFPGTIASLSILPVIWVVKLNFSLEVLILGIILYCAISIFLLKITLFNKRDKELGFITYKDSQAQVNISTQLIADKKIQLFMDYISFKVDL